MGIQLQIEQHFDPDLTELAHPFVVAGDHLVSDFEHQHWLKPACEQLWRQV